MNITAVISIGTSLVPAVPSTALANSGGQDFIFIVSKETPPKHEGEAAHATKDSPEVFFERIAVLKGVSDIGYTEITPVKELPKDTKIVTKGAFFIMAKMVNTGEH